jgi:hypothetical protein
MEIKLNDYIHLYLGSEVFVQKKQGNENLLRGQICDVTSGSNHGDWIRVSFDTCVTVINSHFEEVKSNFHTFFIGEDTIKLSLRRLSSMTDEEIDDVWHGHETQDVLVMEYSDGRNVRKVSLTAERTRYLLSKGFDLFGLIDAGLAIEKDSL